MGNLRGNSGPSDEAPVLLDTSTQSNLLTDIGASRTRQNQFRGVFLDVSNLGASRSGSNVDHDDFVLGQLLDLGLLPVGGPHALKASQEIKADFYLSVDIGHPTIYK